MYSKKYYFYTKTKILGAGRLLPRPDIVPKEDWGSMILEYPTEETAIRRLKYCCVTFQYTGLLNVHSY